MNKLLGLTSVVFAILLAGCGLIKEQRQVAISKIYTDLQEVAKEVPAILSLNKGESPQILISEDFSPRLARNKHTDYFEVVEVQGVKDQAFSLMVHAVCDCLGVRKWAVLSEVYLVSPSGKEVQLSQSGLQTRQVSGIFSDAGTHKLIIVAASKYSGQRMGRISGYIFAANAAVPLSLPLTVHPTGTLKLEYK
ncbi:hypothetical protein ACJJI4_06745 [Microbulbifer sp. TRSA002]|uniref:hypothetical protein n=1 Tax=Microbulbifer sp. TRSA002 TaxID=3243382 RepID=UPI00403A392D